MTKIRKICTYITPKSINYGENYQIIIFKYLSKFRAQIQAWKKKIEKTQLDKQLSVTNNPIINNFAIK